MFVPERILRIQLQSTWGMDEIEVRYRNMAEQILILSLESCNSTSFVLSFPTDDRKRSYHVLCGKGWSRLQSKQNKSNIGGDGDGDDEENKT